MQKVDLHKLQSPWYIPCLFYSNTFVCWQASIADLRVQIIGQDLAKDSELCQSDKYPEKFPLIVFYDNAGEVFAIFAFGFL